MHSVTSKRHLPGCYRHFVCERDESLIGYLLRLAHANGYSGIREFLRLMNLRVSPALRKSLLNLYGDPEKLTRLGRIATGDAGHFRRFYAEPLPAPMVQAEALYREERRVDLDALLPERAPICPPCLKELGRARETWDLAPVTACVQHRKRLVDECPVCGSPITWDRPDIFHCKDCAQDFRGLEPEPASEGALAVVADFQALAPFRCQDNEGYRFVADWEEMFHLFKALLLPDDLWAEGLCATTFVAESKVQSRHAVIEELATILEDRTYDVSKLRDKAEVSLAPLTCLPIRNALQDAAVQYLTVTVGLSPELAAAICHVDVPGRYPAAAEIYSGRPPSLSSHKAVEEFLGASAIDVSKLFKLGVIAPLPENLIGYDADHLVGARKLLDSLLGLEELTKLIGVPVHESDLHPEGLFPRWNSDNRTDARVMPQRAIELQRALAVRWHRSSPPQQSTSLRALAKSVERPFALVAGVAKEIIMGSIEHVAWEPPFSWVDLGIPLNKVDAALRLGTV